MTYEAPEHIRSMSRSLENKRVTPETRDIAFNKHSKQDGKHVSPSDNGLLPIGLDGIKVRMVKGIDEESFKRVVSMGLRATTGVNLDEEINPDEDMDEMLKGGLQQALESDRLVFAVTGVTRACTHQLVRTRNAGFLQQSQRATFFGKGAEVRIPESVWAHPNPAVLGKWLAAIDYAQQAYGLATDNDISYQDARLILPEGTTNSIVCSYTPREWLNVLAYRGCRMFQWEISHVFRLMRALVVEAYPWLEPHAKVSCEKTGKCHFQGWEQVEAQCDLPMAREDNRLFKSTRYAIEDDKPTPLAVLRRILILSRGGEYPVVFNRELLAQQISIDLKMAGSPFDERMPFEAIEKAIHAGELRETQSHDPGTHVEVVRQA